MRYEVKRDNIVGASETMLIFAEVYLSTFIFRHATKYSLICPGKNPDRVATTPYFFQRN